MTIVICGKLVLSGFDRFLYAPRHKSLTRHIVLTLLLIVGTLGIAMTTNDLGVVLAFNVSCSCHTHIPLPPHTHTLTQGCLTAIPLAFVIPTACYLTHPPPPSHTTHTLTQGCLTAIPLAFVIPTACYLKLSKSKWCSRGKIFALLVMVFGLIVMVLGTVLAVIEVSYVLYLIIIKITFHTGFLVKGGFFFGSKLGGGGAELEFCIKSREVFQNLSGT